MDSTTEYRAYPDEGSNAATNARRKVLAACIGVYLVQYSQSQAMIAPFLSVSLPGVLIGPDLVGIVFSAYPLATALATPLPSLVIRNHGVSGMVVLGLTLTALANLAFGVAGALAAEEWTSVLGVALTLSRALGGVGAALSEAGCLTAITAAGWGDDLGKALSLIEVTTGTGAAIGAALGGWLYPLGGFFLPMAVGAVLPLLVLPVALAFLPKDCREDGASLRAGKEEIGEELLAAERSSSVKSDGSAGGAGGIDGMARRIGRYTTCASLFTGAAVFEG